MSKKGDNFQKKAISFPEGRRSERVPYSVKKTSCPLKKQPSLRRGGYSLRADAETEGKGRFPRTRGGCGSGRKKVLISRG